VRLVCKLSGDAGLSSRSPGPIPSSLTSVHSSSAIFECDIEPISCSPSYHLPNPRRTPRSRQTKQLDQSVPSVLDSAAAILASSTSTLEDDRINAVAHAPSAIAPAGIAAGKLEALLRAGTEVVVTGGIMTPI